MKNVRIGVIGAGCMASLHMNNIKKTENAELTCVCDVDLERAKAAGQKYNCRVFNDHKELLKGKVSDAVMIVTPHYFHTTTGIDALNAGHHVLVEKPISVHKADCERLIAAHKKNNKLVFAAMFNMRTDPHYKKIKQLIDSGELGALIRVTWIITNWFRTNAYFASGSWRATWKGEGGGVLLNQCPHQLDLFQWLCGMPKKVHGFCGIGKRHNIEVEDEVTAYMEYKNGATGVFITSTGEAPGTNRLEIAGECGKVVLEGDVLTFTRNEVPANKFIKTSKQIFATPDVWNITIPVNGNGGQHAEILQNFVNAILKGEKLIAPAEEGIHSVELGNAILYSSMTAKPVEMPLDSRAYEKMLNELIRKSKFTKKTAKKIDGDLSKSFNK
ncbi:MAG: Gfo/Idh/MocA family oxidoreductase [bacterium]|nr:Gfo/Idh/MocA family oxidoreductase [bacterium]